MICGLVHGVRVRAGNNHLLVGLDAISAVFLGPVKHGIGAFDNFVDRDIGQAAGNADAHRDGDLPAVGRKSRRFECHAHAFGDDAGIGKLARNDRDEFLAAEPADNVVCTHRLLHGL